ncbi:hypothetical protein T8J41_22045 (plasmid) [Nitratireductor rhodophyticola]|uniref:CMD domain-containing protein n=1 Tax=Nitratireductor rhodophyticola TaxID=2854036 RepID=UPI002AC98FF7|nr:hypothetical protein [Nitratireductor rhodophyticola]WPZ16569.1 hypothetical protein T8J41_22045 [Nitratireductor rhodophyticola]
MSDLSPNDIVIAQAGIGANGSVREALEGRADIMAMTQATHDAALKPSDPGGLSHGERAALAARVARLNKDEALAAHYMALLEEAGADEAVSAMADPAHDGEGDARRAALLAYTDLVSTHPRDTTPEDIEALKSAGISDADIVRLSELNAFLAYQIRVIAGLKLMKATA